MSPAKTPRPRLADIAQRAEARSAYERLSDAEYDPDKATDLACASASDVPALTAALREVLAEAARVRRDANDAWTRHSECADAGDVDAANVHGAMGESLDGIAARLRRAITARIDVT